MSSSSKTVQGASESAAIQVLKRAVQLDEENRYGEALACYEQGIRLLLTAAKETEIEDKKEHFKKKANEYLSRAEKVKKASEQQKESLKHKQIHINNGDTGFSYDKIFSPLIDRCLRSVEVEDAYIRSIHQIYNFLRLCELLVKKAPNIGRILLLTSRDPQNERLQMERLNEIKTSLSSRNINLKIEFSDTLHDREIRFDTGWVVKIGRGLDIFKKPESSFAIGYTDFELRTCYETTIDIFHRRALKS